MKVKSKRRALSSLMVVFLVSVMALASGISSLFKLTQSEQDAIASSASYITKHLVNQSDPTKYIDNSNLAEEDSMVTLNADDYVDLIVKIDSTSLFTMFESQSSGLSYQDFILTRNSRIASENMAKKQRQIFTKLSKKVDVKLAGSVTGIINAFTVRMKYGDRERADEILSGLGVSGTSISEVYERPQLEVVTNEVDVYESGIFKTDGVDFDGSGMVVAVLDTGLDYNHPAFSDSNLPTDGTSLGLTKTDVSRVLNRLYANNSIPVESDDNNFNGFSNGLTVSDLYVNDKVPFAYDYADCDPEVNTDEENMHGTHVAGIIVGKSTEPGDSDLTNPKYQDKNGNAIVGITGAAPMAQVAVMKVFPDTSSGASTHSLIAALNDCAILSVDVINMSLGSSSGFSDQRDDDVLQDAYEAVGRMGISLIVAAGNSYSSGRGGHYGTNLTSNPDSGTLGSPAGNPEAMSVASIEGVKSKYIRALDRTGSTELSVAYITEGGRTDGSKWNFIENMIAAIGGDNTCNGYNETEGKYNTGVNYTSQYYRGDGEYWIPFVVIPGVGESGNYTKSVTGKIALIKRGRTTFTDKLENAKTKGALGAIIYNNVAGTISMSIESSVSLPYPFPACSIQLDAAKSIAAAQGGEGYIVIKTEYQGGPFMSDFSSWGPMPNLELKPEITGHGGEIYSAAPGKTDNGDGTYTNHYSRISGTSMAAPNVAGVTTLARQHVIANDDKYGITYDRNEPATRKQVENTVYQIMMSTATLPRDEYGNVYSPRRIGAGIANIKGLVNTNAYITVDKYEIDYTDPNDVKLVSKGEYDRTKIELYDYYGNYAGAAGVYPMSFRVNNTGGTDLKFKPDSIVMTETVSSDGKTVAERPYPLAGTTAFSIAATQSDNGSYDSTNNIITVKAGQTLTVGAVLTLTTADMKYIDDNFANGMYVEGYLTLESLKETGESITTQEREANAETYKTYVDLNVPFLAFYGDWTQAPILDYSIYETDVDDKDTNMNEDDKRYSQGMPTTPFGKLSANGGDYIYDIGKFLFYVAEPYEDDVPYAEEEKTCLSLGESSIFGLFYVGGFIRGCKRVEYRVIDTLSGDVLYTGEKYNARKYANYGGLGGLKMDINPKEIGCKNNGVYRFEMSGYLDYGYNKSDPDAVPSTPSKPAKDGKSTSTWAFNFTIDSDAPIIEKCEVRFERDSTYKTYEKYLDFYLRDEHYVEAMSFTMYNKTLGSYESMWDKGIRPVSSGKNTTNKVTYNLTQWWDHIVANDYKIATEIYDWALNGSYYEINLKSLAVQAAEIDLVDIGIYTTYLSGSGQITVLSDCYDKYEELLAADGSFRSMDSITILPGQPVYLDDALITQPAGVWDEEIVWTSSNTAVVRINSKTGEIYAAGAGTAEITIAALHNPSEIKKILTVKVLSAAEMEAYGVPAYKGEQELSLGVSETFPYNNESNPSRFRGYKVLNPGEEYEVTLDLDPWYFDMDRILSVEWETLGSSATLVDTSTKDADGKFTAISTKVTAKKGDPDTDGLGNYTPNIAGNTRATCRVTYLTGEFSFRTSVSFYVYVPQEFEIDNGVLTGYNGVGGEVIIPYNSGKNANGSDNGNKIEITEIGSSCFLNMHHITKITVPEGVTKINSAAFAYMHNLKEVILPSTIKVIGDWAFAADKDISKGATTSLQIVDTTSFKEEVHVGNYAFQNQYMLGSTGTMVDGEMIWGSSRQLTMDCKLDFSHFKVIGKQAFLYCEWLWKVNLTSCISIGTVAFGLTGIIPAQNLTVTSINRPTWTFGENIVITGGEAAFTLAGLYDVTLQMSRIPSTAFADCFTMNKLTFEADNVCIEPQAFMACYDYNDGSPKGLNEVIFNGTVSYIGDEAFAECENLGANTGTAAKPKYGTVTFNKTCAYIGDRAFSKTALTTFNLAPGLEHIGKGAFSGSPIKTLNIMPGFTADMPDIDFDSAFSTYIMDEGTDYEYTSYTSLTTIQYDGQTTGGGEKYWVENNMILSADKQTLIFAAPAVSITLPSSVTTIKPYAFANNTENTTINLGNVTDIGKGAFSNCTALTTITLPNSLTKIPANLFDGAINLSTLNWTPANIETIGDAAFRGTALTSVGTLSNLISLGDYAFANSALTSFVIPSGILAIPDYAFDSCANLAMVTFHAGVTKIGTAAFRRTAVTELSGSTVAGILEIAADAFNNCKQLNTVNLANVITIGARAFYVSSNGAIESLSLEKAVTIGESTFENQKALNRVSLPYAKTIQNKAFASSGVNELHIPKAEEIGDYAFAYTRLGTVASNITIPKTVDKIGVGAFADVKVLGFEVEDQNKDSRFKAIDGVLFRNIQGGIELVQYPAGATRKEYVIPEGTIRINDYAFYLNKTLTKVTLPFTLKNIGHAAFLYTSNLKTYEFLSWEAPVLESWYSYILDWYPVEADGTISTRRVYDMNDHYWPLYANFYDYFNIPEMDSQGNPTGNWIYNNITSSYRSDTFPSLNNSVNGAGFSGLSYGLTIINPINGKSYDSFLYSNYFTNKLSGPTVAEPGTLEIIARIEALPTDFSTLTEDDKLEVEEIRYAFNLLGESQQRLVTNYDKLREIEDYLVKQGDYITVTFMSEGVVFDTVNITKGKSVYVPFSPEKTYYKFNGWYLGDAAFDFETKLQVNTTLTARFVHGGETFTVTFADCDLEPVSVLKGMALEKPANPTKKGYKFTRWELDDKEYDFSGAVTGDITLTAKYKKGCGSCSCGTLGDINGGTIGLILGFMALMALTGALVLRKRAKKAK